MPSKSPSSLSLARVLIESLPSVDKLTFNFTKTMPAAKQAVILHDGPDTTPNATVQLFVKTDKVKALYITNKKETTDNAAYSSLPTDLSNFVTLLEAAQVAKK